MSQDGNINQVSSSTSAAPSASDPTTAAAAASSNGGEEVTSATTVSSMGDLKRKAPKLYKYMMLSLAQNICIQLSQAQDRLKESMRKMGDRESYQ